ncbi:hypothetical protein C8F04DRAFT_1231524 [Mycena alexandri]|uniref:Uncharacterized protein n=1 Tax=Mycena alexandri TaxID=1745969 RepID=A0AAD6T8N2_9AGAR|nr:hypothetical protein C8F04DRAFT_1231524 [Mycena alexandri]
MAYRSKDCVPQELCRRLISRRTRDGTGSWLDGSELNRRSEPGPLNESGYSLAILGGTWWLERKGKTETFCRVAARDRESGPKGTRRTPECVPTVLQTLYATTKNHKFLRMTADWISTTAVYFPGGIEEMSGEQRICNPNASHNKDSPDFGTTLATSDSSVPATGVALEAEIERPNARFRIAMSSDHCFRFPAEVCWNKYASKPPSFTNVYSSATYRQVQGGIIIANLSKGDAALPTGL